MAKDGSRVGARLATQKAPAWKQWLKESKSDARAIAKAVAANPEDAAVKEAATAKLLEQARQKSARDNVASRQRAAYLEWVNARAASTEQWTFDHVLAALTTWDRDAALWALGLPIVQHHLTHNRIGREPERKQARHRLEQAIIRLLTDPSNKGGRKRAPALKREDVVPRYRKLVAALEAVKREYYDDGWAYAGADAVNAVDTILSDFLIPPPKTARDWIEDLAGKPSDVAVDMLAEVFKTSPKRVEKAIARN